LEHGQPRSKDHGRQGLRRQSHEDAHGEYSALQFKNGPWFARLPEAPNRCFSDTSIDLIKPLGRREYDYMT